MELVDSLKGEYFLFSSLAVLTIFLNLFQLFTVCCSEKGSDGRKIKMMFEDCACPVCIGIVSLVLLGVYSSIGESFEGGRDVGNDGTTDYRMEVSFYSRQYIPVRTLMDEGRYSKFA